jgi:hypothetical protein
MDVELDPKQPEPVVAAVAELLGQTDGPETDPWWQAGIDETLGNGSSA